MRSPNLNNNFGGNDSYELYKQIIYEGLQSIVYSKDYIKIYAPYDRVDRKKIKDNQLKIAELATEYFINNNGHDLSDPTEIGKLIRTSINEAVKQI